MSINLMAEAQRQNKLLLFEQHFFNDHNILANISNIKVLDPTIYSVSNDNNKKEFYKVFVIANGMQNNCFINLSYDMDIADSEEAFILLHDPKTAYDTGIHIVGPQKVQDQKQYILKPQQFLYLYLTSKQNYNMDSTFHFQVNNSQTVDSNITKDQIQKINALSYWTNQDSEPSILTMDTSFSISSLKPYFIANGSNNQQNVTLDFEINLDISNNNQAYIISYSNFANNLQKDVVNYIELSAPNTYYKGSASYTLNQNDIIKFFIVNGPGSSNIKIGVSSLYSKNQPSIKSKIEIYILIFILSFFVFLILLWFYHHFHGQPQDAKKG